ncbi:MAG: tyrosine-type recombinase/integrase [Thermodesulfobacteriota bacterium]
MGLYKRGKVWWMSFVCKGRHYRKSTETEDRKLAQRIHDMVRGEIAEGKWFEQLPGEMKTLKEATERYLKRSTQKVTGSRQNDRCMSNTLIRFFGLDIPMAQITPSLVSDYKEERIRQNIGSGSINNELNFLSHLFRIGIREWQWVRQNPVKDISREKVIPRHRWLTDEEEEKLLEACPGWLRELVVFAVQTGLREDEILSLQWSQIDFTRNTLTIWEQKNKESDTLPINDTAMAVLRSRARHIRSPLVFTNSEGKKIRKLKLLSTLHEACEKAGLKHMHFHDLRHTWATWLHQDGGDLLSIQRLGRWKDGRMLQRYAHHSPESLRATVKILDQRRMSQKCHSDQVGDVSSG